MTRELTQQHTDEAVGDPRVFEYAHEYLAKRELAKDKFFDWSDGKNRFPDDATDRQINNAKGCCIMGALYAGARHYGYVQADPFRMVHPATDLMHLPQPANWWNNRPERTKDEVLAALEQGRYYASLEA